MADNGDSLKDRTSWKALAKDIILKIFLPAVLIIFTVNVVFRGPEKGEPLEIIKKASSAGNYKVVREQYKALIDKGFFNLEYHRGYLSSCYRLTRGQEDSEDTGWKEYVRYSSDGDANISDIGHYGLGYFFSLRHSYPEALGAYGNVKNRELPFLNNSIGHAYLRLRDNEKAREYFLREIEFGGNLSGAYFNLAILSYEQRDFEGLTKLVSNEKARGFIPGRIVRIVNLKNGRILSYLFSVFSYRHVKSYGFAAALLILLIWFYYLRSIDVFEPEKLGWLLLTLAGGMFFAEVCTGLYDFWDWGLGFRVNGRVVNDLLYCIFGIGLIEEAVKIIPFLLMLRFSRQVNESIDYLIYASVSALGFAFMENLIYFQEWGIRAITGRALTSVLLHISLSGMAVYGLVYSKYRKNHRRKLLYFAVGFVAAVVIHGLYDFVLISNTLAAKLGIFSLLILFITMNKYGIMIKNALNVSEFNTEHKMRAENLSRYLVYSLSVVVLLQYVLMAWRFGARNANLSMLKTVLIYYFLILIIISNLGRIEIIKSKWRGLFERKKRRSKPEEASHGVSR